MNPSHCGMRHINKLGINLDETSVVLLMWSAISKYFSGFPAQEKVARTLLNLGIGVRNGKIDCGGIIIPPQRVAKSIGVDRRAVIATIKTISSKKELDDVYRNLRTATFFKDVASALNWGVIEIIPTNPSIPGIVSGVTRIIGDFKINVRQCITQDPEFSEEAKLFVITEKTVPPAAIPRLRKVRGVKSITIH